MLLTSMDAPVSNIPYFALFFRLGYIYPQTSMGFFIGHTCSRSPKKQTLGLQLNKVDPENQF